MFSLFFDTLNLLFLINATKIFMNSNLKIIQIFRLDVVGKMLWPAYKFGAFSVKFKATILARNVTFLDLQARNRIMRLKRTTKMISMKY